MDVAVSELRANLSRWIEAARDGDDVVITDRGTPVARIIAVDSASLLERLTAEGIISRPAQSSRPIAGRSSRPTPKRPIADLVSEQRS
ncbi:MAG: type II toxin-antitoxin system prevent-host-death family antitoxin [Actinomycetota bacterium]